MTTINKETLEAWLFFQNPARIFNYIEGFKDDKTGCLICNFIRETTNIQNFCISAYCFDILDENNKLIERIDFPTWLITFLRMRNNISFNDEFSAGLMQKCYNEMFGDFDKTDIPAEKSINLNVDKELVIC